MRILLTNDDGLHAVGIQTLYAALHAQGRHEILVVAPATVQSAGSHALTFDRPLRISREPIEHGGEGIAVSGSPGDCVKLAMHSLWIERFGPGTRPDLLISGINMGSNCGINHHYSGTVAAAREGAILGVPSIALSLQYETETPRWDVAAEFSLAVLEKLCAGPLTPRTCLSVNLPPAEAEGPMPAICVCPMNAHACIDQYERRLDPRGGEYYWPVGYGPRYERVDPGSDVDRVEAGSIAVTPLDLDATSSEDLARWRGFLEDGG